MPKEMIHSKNGPFVRTEDGSEYQIGDPDCPDWQEGEHKVLHRAVHVGWSNHYVEVGVGAFVSATGEGSQDAHYTDLDRDGINRLIRALRKARDRAFGADA